MRDIDLGKVTWTPKGAWNNATTFEYVDIVRDGYGLFISLQDNNLNHPTSDTNYWFKLYDFTQMVNDITFAVLNALPTILDVEDVEGIIAAEVGNKYLSKLRDDIANGYITFRKGLQIGDTFVSGLLGEGGVFNKNNDGTTHIEADTLYIRMKAYFDTVEIRKYIHSGGNRIASAAGGKCVRVERIDANGDVTTVPEDTVLFRCYFRGSDGERECTNDFVIGDQAYCKITSAQSNDSLYQHSFWRMVVGRNTEGTLTDDGEYWIDLSNREYETLNGVTYSGYLSGSDAPLAQDDIVQLGNKNDSTRQGAIIEYVTGNNSPSYQIFQGINNFSLDDKNYINLGYDTSTGRAFINVFGDAFIGDKGSNPASYIKYDAANRTLDIKGRISASSTISGQTIDEYIASHSSDWSEEEINALIHDVTDGIQAQIDGQIESWFYDYLPVSAVDSKVPLVTITIQGQTVPCEPYYSWYTADHGGTAQETTTERIKHLGDTFYDNSSGYAFRFTRNESTNAFEWTIIEDSAVITALQNAARAQDTADHKRRVFICDSSHQTPTPPYDEGDLWVNVKYPWATGATYDNEILKCINTKASGSFDIADWSLANGYTAKLNNFVTNTYAPFVQDISNQVDKKAETWRQASDPSLAQGWVAASHVGDIWMDTSANGGNKTYIYQNMGTAAEPNYRWEPQAVPEEVFDKIDGKAAIYVGWEDWIVGGVSQLQDKDLFIPAADAPSGSTFAYKANKVYKWKSSTNSWVEISYTDDARLLAFLDGYTGNLTNIQNDINTAGDRYLNSAVMNAIKNAVGGTTVTEGGLMLTSLLAMRKFNGSAGQESDPTKYTTWGGLSGVYDPIVNVKGHGIAAWYGGGMVDLEDLPSYWDSTQIATWNAMSAADKAASPLVAKSVDRMDGSGYRAFGNISWDADGTTRLRGVSLTTADGQTTIQVSNIASLTYVNDTFLSKEWFNQLFKLHYKASAGASDSILAPNNLLPNGAVDISLESVFGFWTNYGLTALGRGIDGTHVVGVLDDLNDVTITNPQANQVLKYNGTQWVNAAAPSGASALSGLTDVAISSLADKDLLQWDYASGKWKNVVLSTVMSAYALASAIPTNVSQLNNDSGYVTSSGVTSVATGTGLTGGTITSTGTISIDSTYQTYISNGNTAYGWGNHANAGYATQSWVNTQLGSYLPLSGGTISSPSFDSLVINRAGSYYSAGITFKNSGDGVLGSIAIGGSANGDFANKLWCSIGANNYHILHSGNSSVSKSGETLSVTINGVTQSLTNSTYTVNNATLSLQANGVTKTTFYANDSTNRTFNIGSGSANGTISVGGTDVSVTGLGSNAYDSTAYLPLSGGTISNSSFGALIIHRNYGGYAAGIRFSNVSDGEIGTLNVSGSSNAYADAYSGTHALRFHPKGATTDYAVLHNGMTELWTVESGYRKANITNTGWISAYILNNSGGFSTSYCVRNSSDTNIGGVCGCYGAGGAIVNYFYGGTYSSAAICVIASSNNVGIGTMSPSYKLEISAGSQQTPLAISRAYDGNISYFIGSKGTSGADSYTMRIRNSTGGSTGSCIDLLYGNVYITDNLIASGGVTALSDERHKTIVEDTRLQVDDIARMRAVRYIWNDGREDKGMHVGSIAQDWQQILPEVVLRANNDEGTLSLQYGVAALISSITIARKVVNHEERINALERENADLKQAYSFIKNAYDYLKMDYENLKLKIA